MACLKEGDIISVRVLVRVIKEYGGYSFDVENELISVKSLEELTTMIEGINNSCIIYSWIKADSTISQEVKNLLFKPNLNLADIERLETHVRCPEQRGVLEEFKKHLNMELTRKQLATWNALGGDPRVTNKLSVKFLTNNKTTLNEDEVRLFTGSIVNDEQQRWFDSIFCLQ